MYFMMIVQCVAIAINTTKEETLMFQIDFHVFNAEVTKLPNNKEVLIHGLHMLLVLICMSTFLMRVPQKTPF